MEITLEWEKLLASLGAPALMGVLVTAIIQVHQSRRPQNRIKEMLENRAKMDSLKLRSKATSEAIRGLDNLIALEAANQIMEKEYRFRKNSLNPTNHLLNLASIYIIIFLLVIGVEYLYTIEFIGSSTYGAAAVGVVVLTLVVTVMYLVFVAKSRIAKKEMLSDGVYFDSELLKDSDYQAGFVDAIISNYGIKSGETEKSGLFASFLSLIKRRDGKKNS